MTVNWTAISTISELVGAVVVVVTLCYLAVQIRQNTNAILANSRQTLLDADLGLISDFVDHVVDPHLIGDEVQLTPEDQRRFTWLLVKAIRIREFAWHQYKSGNPDEKSWQFKGRPRFLHGKSGIRARTRRLAKGREGEGVDLQRRYAAGHDESRSGPLLSEDTAT